MSDLTDAERLKFALLAEGVTIRSRARDLLTASTADRPLTPADYASTSGVILRLDDDVWVNAPTTDFNPNFVEQSPYVLDAEDGVLFVRGADLESRAQFWPPPLYHGTQASDGRPANYYAITHGDRVRVSPVEGCAMVCKFCNIPYDDRYGTKAPDMLVEGARTAIDDPLQPAHHMLISGGTPHDRDIGYLQGAYEAILAALPGFEVDIMMVPIDGLLDLTRLDALGLHQLSINIELVNTEAASRLMRQKFGRGLDWYLRFLGQAAQTLGPGRVRSMLLVGLEPTEDTLSGVRAIAERGCIPVLSPFRPSPSTPLADIRPPTAAELEDVYLRALEVVFSADAMLGPDCPPCSHNTLTLMSGIPNPEYRHPMPFLV